MLSLDLSFYNWELFTNYILKGLLFSVQLTVIATVGGILFGTFLALMRLSGKVNSNLSGILPVSKVVQRDMNAEVLKSPI